MIISNKNKRSKGRQSLRTMTVRRGLHHATIIFSRKTGNDLDMKLDNKISIICEEDLFYICPDAKEGTNIKIAKNGQGVPCFRISNKELVEMLLQAFNANNIAVLLISSVTKEINGRTYYQIIKKALRVDKQ